MRFRLHPQNVVTVVFGLCFVAVGFYIYSHMGRFIDTARTASAVVIEVTHESEGTKKGRTHPVVRFTSVDGTVVVGRSQQHHNLRVGQTVQILYDPKNPAAIEVKTLSQVQNQRVFFSVVCVLIGLVVSLTAAALDAGLLRKRHLIRS